MAIVRISVLNNGIEENKYVETSAEAVIVGNTTLDKVLPGMATLASPAFSGTPTAPTAYSGTNTNQLATTAFVSNALTGTAGSALRLSTPRTISLTGDVTGSALFDGSENANINTSVTVAEQSVILPTMLKADTELIVPAYIVGSNKIQVWVDGAFCVFGSSASNSACYEVGLDGQTSTSIKFYDDYPAGTQIFVRCK